MKTYYVNVYKTPNHYRTIKLAAIDINDLRCSLLKKKMLDDAYEVDVLTENNRLIGTMYLVKIRSTSLWTKAPIYKVDKKMEPVYAIWVTLTGRIRKWDFVRDTGRLQGNGHYVMSPDAASRPIVRYNRRN